MAIELRKLYKAVVKLFASIGFIGSMCYPLETTLHDGSLPLDKVEPSTCWCRVHGLSVDVDKKFGKVQKSSTFAYGNIFAEGKSATSKNATARALKSFRSFAAKAFDNSRKLLAFVTVAIELRKLYKAVVKLFASIGFIGSSILKNYCAVVLALLANLKDITTDFLLTNYYYYALN